MLDDELRRQTPPLPVINSLLEAFGLLETEQLGKGDITTSSGDQASGLVGIHGANLNAMFKEKSNEMCNTPLNDLFRMRYMRRRPAQERTIDRVLRWASELGMNQTELAKRMGVSSGRLTNWKRRGMPAREAQKAAEVLERNMNELLGIEAETARAIPSVADLLAAWPFRFPRDRFEQLDPEQKIAIENAVLSLIVAFESAGISPPSKRSA